MLAYIIASVTPILIVFILITALIERKDALKLFGEGVTNGIKTTYKVFPYIFAITIASNLLRETGTISLLISPLSKIFEWLKIPEGLVPLIVLRPMSGSASTALVLDAVKTFGVNSIEGKLATVIMGGTETTLYVIAILLGSNGIKNYRGAIMAGIISDVVAILTAVILLNIGII